jgi:glycosyltransferase involved in cell wall biosynthesis
VKLVHTRRVSYPLKRGWSFRKYRIADLVVAVSRDIAESLAQSGIDQDKIEVIHSGIVPEAYQQSGKAAGGEETVFGLIGAFTPQKGVEVFLKALAEIRRMRPEFRWLGLVVGEGPLGERLEDLTVELGIDDAVSFPGFVESRDVLCGVDVLVAPSMHGEGSSGTIKEGWAAGVPVVCSDLEANLELISHEVTGLVARRGDEKALAESLLRLVEDEKLAGRLRAGGEERVKEFTVRRMADAYRRLYEDLVRGGGKAYPQA